MLVRVDKWNCGPRSVSYPAVRYPRWGTRHPLPLPLIPPYFHLKHPWKTATQANSTLTSIKHVVVRRVGRQSTRFGHCAQLLHTSILRKSKLPLQHSSKRKMSTSRKASGSTVPFTPRPARKASNSRYSLTDKEITKVCLHLV